MVIVNQVDGHSTDPLTTSQIAKSINLITGLSVGTHFIVPPAYNTYNFDITYDVGNLTVQPGTLTIKAHDETMSYGASLPTFFSEISGVAYNDELQKIVTGPPTYTILDAQNNPVLPLTLKPGTYQIMPSAAGLAAPSNYNATYLPGKLVVGGDDLIIRANDMTVLFGSAIPSFTSSFKGLKLATATADSLALTPAISYTLTNDQNQLVTASATLPKGIYVIRPVIINQNVGTNYLKKYEYGILYVK
jgi:hypothetical protein